LNSVCRQRPRTVEVMAGYGVLCAGESFRAKPKRSLRTATCLLQEQE
jgi:hypothetical protein